jgi:NADH-quinone oxidoreductase subunit M
MVNFTNLTVSLSRIFFSFFLALVYHFFLDLNSILSLLFFFPLAGSFLLLFVPAEKKNVLKIIGLLIAGIEFLLSLTLWINFNKSLSKFQFVEYIHYSFPWDSSSSTVVTLGVDGISLFFVLLTTLLIFKIHNLYIS